MKTEIQYLQEIALLYECVTANASDPAFDLAEQTKNLGTLITDLRREHPWSLPADPMYVSPRNLLIKVALEAEESIQHKMLALPTVKDEVEWRLATIRRSYPDALSQG